MTDKQTVLNTVEMISQLMGELESKAFELEGFSDVTMNQMHYLETVARLGKPTFGELAEELGVTSPSVTGIVKKLIKAGYLTKKQSQLDGRVYHLLLTDKGNRFNELHTDVHRILARRITENLEEEEISALAGLLGRITGN